MESESLHDTNIMLGYPTCFRYEEALQLYKRAMDDTPTSAVLWKRKVAVLKAKGDTKDAISELNALLNV